MGKKLVHSELITTQEQAKVILDRFHFVKREPMNVHWKYTEEWACGEITLVIEYHIGSTNTYKILRNGVLVLELNKELAISVIELANILSGYVGGTTI